jgi:hypothetical protein
MNKVNIPDNEDFTNSKDNKNQGVKKDESEKGELQSV